MTAVSRPVPIEPSEEAAEHDALHHGDDNEAICLCDQAPGPGTACHGGSSWTDLSSYYDMCGRCRRRYGGASVGGYPDRLLKVCGRTSGPGEGGWGRALSISARAAGYRVVEVHPPLPLGGWPPGGTVCDAAGAQLERFSSGGGTVAGVVVFDGIAEQLEGRRC
jgi:hypothetical protein